MKVDITREVDTNIQGSVDFKVSNNAHKLFAMLGDYLYSNKRLSVLHEISANARDAHAMNGNEAKPFTVIAPTALDPRLVIRDYGPGLSEGDVYRLLTTYGESDKMDSNSMIGGYGIGSKSPASVTDTWQITSNHGGKCTEYLVYVTAQGIPSIKKIREIASTTTGLEVAIPVAKEDFSQWTELFKTVFEHYEPRPEIKNTTVYFNNAPDKLHEAADKTWYMKNNIGYSSRIAFITSCREYPVNVDAVKAGLKNRDLVVLTDLPLVVKFPIGALQLSLSRESIQYTKSTIEAIEEKLQSIYDVLHEKVKAGLDGQHDQLEYRQKIYAVSKAVFNTGPANYGAIGHFLQKVVNGKYGLKNFPDDLKFINNPISDPEITDKMRVFNGRVLSFVKRTGFNCWKSYNLVRYDGGIRFKVEGLANLKFILADTFDVAARVRHNHNGQQPIYWVIIAKKNHLIPEMQKHIILGTSLPKAPRAVRQKVDKTKIDSPIFSLNTRNFEKVSADMLSVYAKIVYLTFTDARSQDTIVRTNNRDPRTYIRAMQRLGYRVVGLRHGTPVPKSVKMNFICDEYDRLIAEMEKDPLVEKGYVRTQAQEMHYSLERASFYLREYRDLRTTKKKTVWNTCQAELGDFFAPDPDNKAKNAYTNYMELVKAEYQRKPKTFVGVKPDFKSINSRMYAAYPLLKHLTGTDMKADVLCGYLDAMKV